MGREALESSSAAFQATAKPSQLPTHNSLLVSTSPSPSRANKKSPMSLRHRAFISRQTVFRPSVTSAKDAAGYFVGTDYLCPRNNPPLCILGSNLVVKTSWKEQPEQTCYFRTGRDHQGLDPSKHLRRRKGSAGSQKNLDGENRITIHCGAGSEIATHFQPIDCEGPLPLVPHVAA